MSNFQVGDKVTWSHVSRHGGTVSIKAREGTIASITGNVAKVKPFGKAKSTSIQLPKLRRLGEQTELSEFVEAHVAANRKNGWRRMRMPPKPKIPRGLRGIKWQKFLRKDFKHGSTKL